MKVSFVRNRDIQDIFNDYAINEIARSETTITIFAMSMYREENMLFVVASEDEDICFYVQFDYFVACE